MPVFMINLVRESKWYVRRGSIHKGHRLLWCSQLSKCLSKTQCSRARMPRATVFIFRTTNPVSKTFWKSILTSHWREQRRVLKFAVGRIFIVASPRVLQAFLFLQQYNENMSTLHVSSTIKWLLKQVLNKALNYGFCFEKGIRLFLEGRYDSQAELKG